MGILQGAVYQKNEIMNQNEVNHNISLTFDFIRELIRNPQFLEKLPDEFELEFIEKDISRAALTNLENKQLVKEKNSFEIIELKNSNARKIYYTPTFLKVYRKVFCTVRLFA